MLKELNPEKIKSAKAGHLKAWCFKTSKLPVPEPNVFIVSFWKLRISFQLSESVRNK